jgi:hypothetical protein
MRRASLFTSRGWIWVQSSENQQETANCQWLIGDVGHREFLLCEREWGVRGKGKTDEVVVELVDTIATKDPFDSEAATLDRLTNSLCRSGIMMGDRAFVAENVDRNVLTPSIFLRPCVIDEEQEAQVFPSIGYTVGMKHRSGSDGFIGSTREGYGRHLFRAIA